MAERERRKKPKENPPTKMIWDEARIRAELTRLDGITGLNGGELPIRLNNARCTLGMFSYASPDNLNFTFSNYWFQNPDWSEESALDVIRHEYAHYMDYMQRGESAHDKMWRMCCLKVGAMPTRLYNDKLNDHIVKEHQRDEALSKQYDAYQTGMIVLHPKYGEGVITAIEGEGVHRAVTVDFASVGIKRLGIQWVDTHCAVLPQDY